MNKGTVKWFNSHKSLEDGQEVTYDIAQGNRGLQAVNVSVA